MAKTDITSVTGYIAAQPAATRRVLRRVRSTIRKALPHAEETISYRIPAYKLSKGTIRFPLAEPVPATLIGCIAKFRGKEVAVSAKAKAKKRQPPTRQDPSWISTPARPNSCAACATAWR